MALRLLVTLFVTALVGCSAGAPSGLNPLHYPRGPKFFIAATDYTRGRLDVVSLEETSSRSVDSVPIHSDSVVRAPERVPYIYVVQRQGADSIRIVSKEESRILTDVPLGIGTNPQDIVVLREDLAFVSLHGRGELLKIDPTKGPAKVILARIPLRQFAAEKGNPHAAWMTQEGDTLLIQLQRFVNDYHPSDYSALALFDLKTQRVQDKLVRLRRTNPVTEFKRDPQGRLYVGNAGYMGKLSQLDGAIERLHPVTFESERIVVEEKELGGDIVDFEILQEGLGVAIVSSPRTRLISFDPRTGQRLALLAEGAGYDFHRLVRFGPRVYLLDGNRSRPALRVFDAKSLASVDHFSLGLPPYHGALVK